MSRVSPGRQQAERRRVVCPRALIHVQAPGAQPFQQRTLADIILDKIKAQKGAADDDGEAGCGLRVREAWGTPVTAAVVMARGSGEY